MSDLLSLEDQTAAKRSAVSSASFYNREMTLFTETRPSASSTTSTTSKQSSQARLCSKVVPVSHENKDEIIPTGVYVKPQDYIGLFSGANHRKPNMFNFTFSGLSCVCFHWSLLSLFSSVLCL